jgi:hypothetical protein
MTVIMQNSCNYNKYFEIVPTQRLDVIFKFEQFTMSPLSLLFIYPETNLFCTFSSRQLVFIAPKYFSRFHIYSHAIAKNSRRTTLAINVKTYLSP